MYPVLFRIPGLNYDLPGYGVAMMVSFLVSIMWAARRAVRSGADPDVVLNCGFIALIGGVVGARFMYVWHYWEQFAARGSPLRVFLGVIDVRQGGLEVYGGFICVVVAVLLYLLLRRHSVRWYLDIVAPSAALGMAIGRIGCFLNGCCWGVVSHELPWAVRFPFGSPPMVQQWSDGLPGAELPQQLLIAPDREGAAAIPLPREALRASDAQLDDARRKFEAVTADLRARLARTVDPSERQSVRQQMLLAADKSVPQYAQYVVFTAELMSTYDLTATELRHLAQQHRSLPVHPTQLYSTIGLGLVALLLNTLYWRRRFDGQVICTLLFVEPPLRYVLELLRADNPVDTAGFTISQFLALCLSLVGLLGLILLRRLPPRSPRARLWEPPPEQPSPAKAAR